jgi:hypothetical protein
MNEFPLSKIGDPYILSYCFEFIVLSLRFNSFYFTIILLGDYLKFMPISTTLLERS